ncbi:MAG: Na(+)/H(+) antiporter subunit B [Rhodospirillaceae bacterium]
MMHRKVVLRVVSKFLIPPILLFALYVQWHGDFGPGGGFQAGVIFGSGFILYALLFGVDAVKQVAPPWLTRLLLAIGVLMYGGTGVACLLLGGNYLDYNVLAHDPVHGQHLGILLVEAGVGITVAAAMVTIFNVFAGHSQDGRRGL